MRSALPFLMSVVLGLSILATASFAATESCLGTGTVTHSGEDADVNGTITGSEGDDLIDGSGGPWKIEGLGGDDRICGGEGDDLIYGGPGNDWIDGGPGNDAIDGGDGNDTIDGGPNSGEGDWVYFSSSVTVDLDAGTSNGIGEGTDALSNLENVYGSQGPDTIFGDDGPNYLVGWDGNDFIAARNADDVVNGMAGHDAMFGGAGVGDWLVYFDAEGPVTVDLQTEEATVGSAEPQQDGLSGFESISGSDHNDFLYGDSRTNYLAGGDGEDVLDGRNGFDIATFYKWIDANLRTGEATRLIDPFLGSPGDEPEPIEETDTLVRLEGLWGSSDWDTLIGDRGNNLLRGDAASDHMRGAGGQDYFLHEDDADHEDDAGSISGGTGSYDLVDYSLSSAGLNIDLVSGLNGVGGQLAGVEGLRGSDYSDVFTGNDRANYFFGGDGDDVLRGKGGEDGLAGGANGEASGDILRGGPAFDRCIEDEERTGCEKTASPEPHPLVPFAGSMTRPEALGVGAGGPDDPRRYK